ncbi:acyl-CoA dehydrogenase family protein [Streptomyces sp. VNUA24]|uniref:acyl-CoA dehydrogenase family protein n=1 Tax=Streptomyces sp. VNUA24 TaxID=3031131 RepID=UPI0023B848B6|nr:acyl-CoA dehydrogenase family protein [Streptomyces sp. VNUA24]WEH13000.1 acyl-CoA/acyl-ACP dehydrogenase [Streptomyces sp. VNUA24]
MTVRGDKDDVRPGLPYTELSGFEPQLTDEERALQQAVHAFAAEVLRPAGRALDRMTAEEVIAADSPFWEVHAVAAKSGLSDGPEAGDDVPPALLARMAAVAVEELGWGDAGLAVSLGVGGFPALMARRAGTPELADLCAGRLGCWIGTQPDRGSDGLSLYPEERHPSAPHGNKGNLTARVRGGDIVVNGQSSAWVSNGPVAQVGLASIAADYGEGFYDEDGHPRGIEVIVPLDLPGVSRGKPLEKLGKRALPQGEIFFDDVKVPLRHALSAEDAYWHGHAATWSSAGVAMGQLMTGLARAAFETALAYTHERRQGGALLAEHQLVQYRLGRMGSQVEAMRAVSRRATDYTALSPARHPYYTAQSKAFCTDLAFEVADEALQLMGGNGLTREYPAEKLFRDARAARVEDGENHLLTMKFGHLASLLHQDGRLGAARQRGDGRGDH